MKQEEFEKYLDELKDDLMDNELELMDRGVLRECDMLRFRLGFIHDRLLHSDMELTGLQAAAIMGPLMGRALDLAEGKR